MKQGVHAEDVWGARGRGFSMGIVAPEVRTIHLTGHVAWDANETIVGDGDVSRQTEICFDNIEHLLRDLGGTLDDLVSVTTWFIDREHLSLI